MENMVDKLSGIWHNEIHIQYLSGRTGKMVFTDVVLRCSLIFCLAGAGLWDVWDRRIPNWWLTFWFAAGLGYFVNSSWLAAVGYLARNAAAVGILFLLFLCRMMGAGDIKCMAIICGYLGFAPGFMVIAAGMAFGACWSLGKLLSRKQLGERLGGLAVYFRRMIQEKRLIAYYVPERDGKKVTLPLVFCLFWGLCAFLLMHPL